MMKILIIETFVYFVWSQSINITRPPAEANISDAFENPSCKWQNCSTKNASCRGDDCCHCSCNYQRTYLTELNTCQEDRKIRTECKFTVLSPTFPLLTLDSCSSKVTLNMEDLRRGLRVYKCAPFSWPPIELTSECIVNTTSTTYDNNGWKRLWGNRSELDILIKHGLLKWNNKARTKHKYDGFLITLNLRCRVETNLESSCVVLKISGTYSAQASPKRGACQSCHKHQLLPFSVMKTTSISTSSHSSMPKQDTDTKPTKTGTLKFSSTASSLIVRGNFTISTSHSTPPTSKIDVTPVTEKESISTAILAVLITLTVLVVFFFVTIFGLVWFVGRDRLLDHFIKRRRLGKTIDVKPSGRKSPTEEQRHVSNGHNNAFQGEYVTFSKEAMIPDYKDLQEVLSKQTAADNEYQPLKKPTTLPRSKVNRGNRNEAQNQDVSLHYQDLQVDSAELKEYQTLDKLSENSYSDLNIDAHTNGHKSDSIINTRQYQNLLIADRRIEEYEMLDTSHLNTFLSIEQNKNGHYEDLSPVSEINEIYQKLGE